MNTEIARLEAAADAREREFAAEQTRRDEEKSALGMRVKELEFEVRVCMCMCLDVNIWSVFIA